MSVFRLTGCVIPSRICLVDHIPIVYATAVRRGQKEQCLRCDIVCVDGSDSAIHSHCRLRFVYWQVEHQTIPMPNFVEKVSVELQFALAIHNNFMVIVSLAEIQNVFVPFE